MTLTPPSQPSGSPALPLRPDAEALLLEAVRQRRGLESLERLQRCVHRSGHHWLRQFQTLTLPALAGNDAALWLEALLREGAGHGAPGSHSAPRVHLVDNAATAAQDQLTRSDRAGGDGQQAWIEQRASAAVDGAIASMLAEFPELVPPGPPLGFVLPLTVAPPAPAVPEVLPARTPPPVFSFVAERAFVSLETIASQPEPWPVDSNDASDEELPGHHELSGSSTFKDDPASFAGVPSASSVPWQRTAVDLGSALGSRLLRRFSRSDWRSLLRRATPGGAPQASEQAEASDWQPSTPRVQQGPAATPLDAPTPLDARAAAPLSQDHGNGGANPLTVPDPLAVVVRLSERRSGLDSPKNAAPAPAPAALADLRAWLPDASLPRAS